MFSVLHLIYGFIHLAFAVWAWRIYREKQNLGLVLLFMIAMGLSYDNFVIGIGRFIGISSLLETLSIPRFLIHAILTPTLLITGLTFARAAKIDWATKQLIQRTIWGFVIVLIGLGFWQSIIGMELIPACQDDTIRYVERIKESQLCAELTYKADVLEKGGSPPLASIMTIIGLIIIGAFVWRKSNWYWMIIGGIIMFIAAGIPPSKVGLWVGNGGEIILIASMTFTAVFFFQNLNTQQE